MKNLISILFIFYLLSLMSCKKKKENSEQNTTTPNPIESSRKIDGYVDVNYRYYISNDTSLFYQSSVHAMFYKQAQPDDSLYYLPFDADVGDISVNDSLMEKGIVGSVIQYIYHPIFPNELTQIRSSRVLNISGNETYKKMSIIDKLPLPEYSAFSLPDTIFKTKANTIKLGDYTGNLPIEVVIKFPNGRTRPKNPLRSATEIIFTEADFLSFHDFEPIPVTILFTLINTSYVMVEGKVLCLTSRVSYESREIPFKF